MNKEKVAIIGTNGLPAQYGGFETLTNYLTLHLKQHFDFVVYCSRTTSSQKIKEYNKAKLVYLPLRANGYQSVFYDILSIIHAWFTVDKLLILGNSGALIFPFKIFFKKKIVLNIGGLDWGRNKWNYFIKKYIKFSEWLCIKYSDVVVTDNKYIQYLYKKLYGVESVLIEYGGDHVEKRPIEHNHLEKYIFLKNKYILSVSRAQSDNNIHLLLKAFENLPSHILVIVSNWHTSEYGCNLRKNYKDKFNNMFLVDAVYDQKELDIIRSNAYLYIHSHSFCGTAPSLVEAMNLSLPIICFKSETNIETTENKSYYFNDESELRSLVSEMDQEKLDRISRDMGEIAKKRYTWEIIANKYYNCISN